MIDKVEVVRAYRDELVPMIELAKRYGVSRQAIHKCLRVSGVATGKKDNRVVRPCGWCGKPVEKVRCQARTRKRFFCPGDCYFDWMRAGGEYKPSRHGQRIARSVVGKYFELVNGMVVHHEDGDNLNNLPYNLRVFADQSSHMRHHFEKRGGDKLTVEVLWNGRDLGRSAYLDSLNALLPRGGDKTKWQRFTDG